MHVRLMKPNRGAGSNRCHVQVGYLNHGLLMAIPIGLLMRAVETLE